ncbi:uncharacterized protein LOC122643819 [Telopea speciosissima]|uniref:uncharacterized protein LOC122643819 n=1 Tax=Telopea speciosissima TaxID=54955 RepID=UPI001CC5613C|nr:uncharacterized protein LOC122643819 [Telopea speciosissima]
MSVCRMDRLIINQNLTKVVALLVLLVAQVCSSIICTSGTCRNESIQIGRNRGEGGLLVPMEPTKHQIYSDGISNGGGSKGRRLAPFQLCLQCRCCAASGDPSTCVNMPCCFGIDCQLPDKPFGVCAFVPKSCNCTTCAT